MSFGLSRGRPLEPGHAGLTWADLPADYATRIGAAFFFPLHRPEQSFDLEIGSGKGTFLLQQSALEPETNFLGAEHAGEFFRYAADRVRRAGRANVRLLYGDAIELVTHRLEDACVRGLHIYFSDPWPKARHHKRRVVQDESLRQFHRVLRQDGRVFLVTDHDELWHWYEALAARHSDRFERRDFAPPDSARPGEMVGSNFERKYAREGRQIRGMTLVKRA